jgi:hypothetical protein
MHYAPGKSALGGQDYEDVAHHVFHGAHFPEKLSGCVDLALYAGTDSVSPGKTLNIKVHLFNGKAGHFIPTGSAEERMLWLEVVAVDVKGRVYPLKVKKKGMEGEEFTISDPKARAYQAMGEIMGKEDFKGVSRDGRVPAGCRIFRRPFFDPKGRMTICQWYTAENERIDYRIGPRQTRIETYTWKVPEGVPLGKLTLRAALYYSLVPSSVGRFLELPEEEYAPFLVNLITRPLEVR